MTEVWDFLARYWGVGAGLVGLIAFVVRNEIRTTKAYNRTKTNSSRLDGVEKLNVKLETDLAWIKTTLMEIKEKLK
jgi:hypothetical protein